MSESKAESELLDRLVDGQLGDCERAELLRQIDEEPGGWRRCAIAFLEAQSWRACLQEMCEPGSDAGGRELPRAAPRNVESGAGRRTRVGAVMRWAAVVVAAFTVGWFVSERVREGALEVAAGSQWKWQQGGVATQFAQQNVSNSEDAAESPADGAQTYTLTIEGEDAEEGALEVAVFGGPGFDDRWLEDQPPVLPDYVLRQLERRGFEVSQQRRLYPIELQDGRQLVLPVDEVNVQFVGYERF